MCGIWNIYFSIIVGDIWQAWWESLCINYALKIISIYEYICINYHNTSRILGLKIIFLCYVKQTFRVQPSPPYKCISAQSSGYGLPTHVKFGCHQLPPWKIHAVFLISFPQFQSDFIWSLTSFLRIAYSQDTERYALRSWIVFLYA